MSLELTSRPSLPTVARLAGGLYLLYMGASVLADTLSSIGLGGPPQIAAAITTNPLSFRIGLLVAFASALLFLLTAWALYVMLHGVHRELALLFLLLNAVGVAVQCVSMLPLVAALQLTDPAAGSLAGFTAAQLDTLTTWLITAYKTGFVTAQLFFGSWLFPLGYLVYRSGFLPRILGALLILDGLAEMVWLVQALALPAHPEVRVPGTFVSLLAEVGLALWLLIRGVNVAGLGAGPAAPARTARRGDARR